LKYLVKIDMNILDTHCIMYSSDITFIINRLQRIENRVSLLERNIREGSLLYVVVFITSWAFIKYII
jgi:hypothetical protein